MIDIRQDDTTRVVTYMIKDEDNVIAYGGDRRVFFQPAAMSLEFLNSKLVKVSVTGLKITPTGKAHSTIWKSWNWPSFRTSRPAVAFGDTNPPPFVLEALKDLGYDPNGLPIDN